MDYKKAFRESMENLKQQDWYIEIVEWIRQIN